MPTVNVKITWDTPDEKFWLNPGSIKYVLESFCKNSKFEVEEITEDFSPRSLTEFASHCAREGITVLVNAYVDKDGVFAKTSKHILMRSVFKVPYKGFRPEGVNKWKNFEKGDRD